MSAFLFGAASSAHQSEGNNIHSDWWKFEEEVLSKNGIRSGIATNHYEFFDSDFHLASKLGHNSHRFSIEWAKIEPEEGKIDQKVVEHYHQVFESLKKHGLKPLVTLWHFTLPLWFAEKGGFEKTENFEHFIKYCSFIAKEFKDEMEYVLIMNEPIIYAYNSFLIGLWPPLKKGLMNFNHITNNLIKIYNKTFKELKKINPNFQISIAKNNQVFSAEGKYNILDQLLTAYFRFKWNHYFLNKTYKNMDFIGLNYYFHSCVKFDSHLVERYCHYPMKGEQRSDLNWEIYPEGIYLLIKDLHKRYKKPIIITENGLADHRDKFRPNYIKEILELVFKSKKEGIDIKGYLHWSLTDNFEWAEGFDACFGLIEIDYKTLKRIIRPSAYVYKELIEKYLAEPVPNEKEKAMVIETEPAMKRI